MGKNNKKKPAPPPESLFHILHPASSSSSRAIVDTHTHLASTFEAYRAKYPAGRYETVYDFVKGLYAPVGVEAMVHVWCEAPVRPIWKEFADAVLVGEERAEKWGGVEYWFVMGVHPHEARLYDDAVEADMCVLSLLLLPRQLRDADAPNARSLEAMEPPALRRGRNRARLPLRQLPRPVQQVVFARQLRHAVRLGKPLTIHTRKADEDTERILKEEVPQGHKIHIHRFTDSPPSRNSSSIGSRICISGLQVRLPLLLPLSLPCSPFLRLCSPLFPGGHDSQLVMTSRRRTHSARIAAGPPDDRDRDTRCLHLRTARTRFDVLPRVHTGLLRVGGWMVRGRGARQRPRLPSRTTRPSSRGELQSHVLALPIGPTRVLVGFSSLFLLLFLFFCCIIHRRPQYVPVSVFTFHLCFCTLFFDSLVVLCSPAFYRPK
ncbi:hypothetical protein MSAN_00170300 [Mycena sanguinolenta]|uniref:Metallo-dependent hydrolase n=1 Tax=Mycena sanguinolenta TaxID=230812 RepID=A0A8H6ZEG6_9AGAR|nr:hypothetical protein MSAN_00170300 [Mycena sanguinolenta]